MLADSEGVSSEDTVVSRSGVSRSISFTPALKTFRDSSAGRQVCSLSDDLQQ